MMFKSLPAATLKWERHATGYGLIFWNESYYFHALRIRTRDYNSLTIRLYDNKKQKVIFQKTRLL